MKLRRNACPFEMAGLRDPLRMESPIWRIPSVPRRVASDRDQMRYVTRSPYAHDAARPASRIESFGVAELMKRNSRVMRYVPTSSTRSQNSNVMPRAQARRQKPASSGAVGPDAVPSGCWRPGGVT